MSSRKLNYLVNYNPSLDYSKRIPNKAERVGLIDRRSKALITILRRGALVVRERVRACARRGAALRVRKVRRVTRRANDDDTLISPRRTRVIFQRAARGRRASS